jgi:two-component system sensor histidine kinase UhpB
LVEERIREDLQQELAELQQQTLALARNVRHLSHDLHPTVLQHLGLVKGLTAYCAQLQRTHGVAVVCRAEGDFSLVSPQAALCVYRIAQEALRNVIAHAGASHVDVEVRSNDGHVDISVTDDGRGFEGVSAHVTAEGLGLVSMSERAKLAGGTVSIVTAPAKGTRVQATIPAKSPAKTDRGQETEGQVA